MPRKAAKITHGPAALGPYSHAVWAGKLLYCSGQTPIEPETGALIDGDVEAQTKRIFETIALIRGLGSDAVASSEYCLSES